MASLQLLGGAAGDRYGRRRVLQIGTGIFVFGSLLSGLAPEEEVGATCCFAPKDKVWVGGPDGERWEVYTKLADTETFFDVTPVDSAGGCCR